MKCPGPDCDFDLPDAMEMCVPCARRHENLCATPKCIRQVWFEYNIPMVDRPVHTHCFEHRHSARMIENP